MDDARKPFPKTICVKALSSALRNLAAYKKFVDKYTPGTLGVIAGCTVAYGWPKDMQYHKDFIGFAKFFTLLCSIRAHHRGKIHRPKVHKTLEDQAAYIGDKFELFAYGSATGLGPEPKEISDEEKLRRREARLAAKVAKVEKQRLKEENYLRRRHAYSLRAAGIAAG